MVVNLILTLNELLPPGVILSPSDKLKKRSNQWKRLEKERSEERVLQILVKEVPGEGCLCWEEGRGQGPSTGVSVRTLDSRRPP